MKSIIKSRLYQTVVDKSIWIAAMVCACFADMEWSCILEDMVTGTDSLNGFISEMGVKCYNLERFVLYICPDIF